MGNGMKVKKLNEKELGSLYLIAETPLTVDRIIQKNAYTESDITSLHDTLSHHAPDMAMIAISLSGNIVAEAMQTSEDQALAALAAELKYLSVNTVEEVGRIWIDACRYNVASDDDIRDIVDQASDILCMFASIFMEIAELTTEGDLQAIRAITAALMYQAEAHADTARSLLDNSEDSTHKMSKTSMDDIPLPPEVQNQTYSDNVVMFSLFGESQTR